MSDEHTRATHIPPAPAPLRPTPAPHPTATTPWHRERLPHLAAPGFNDAMPPRALTPAEENAARMAFEMLLKKKLLKVNTGRGRKPGMGPVHAARTYTRTHAHAHTHADRQGDTTQCTHTFT